MCASDSAESAGSDDRLVVFLRHGIAEDRDGSKADELRSLTADGHARMRVIAKGLETIFPKAGAIWTSSLLRAMQTAICVSKAYGSRVRIQTTEALRPAASPADFAVFLRGVEEHRVILVGHEPNLSTNALALLGVDAKRELLELKKGAACAIRIAASDGRATLEWMLTPKILRRLGE